MPNSHKLPLFYALLIVLALFTACMKDKGNYHYNTVNRIKIGGIDSIYIVDYQTRLTIRPQLEMSANEKEDTANYTYTWVADHLVGYTMKPSVLANTRNLDTIISLKYGFYYMYYRVTDKRTGVFNDRYFYLNVGSPSYEGWLLLCDMENGNSRLDMVSHKGTLDTLYRDILGTMHSAFQTIGKPAFVATHNSYIGGPANGTVAIFLGTSKNAVLLGLDTLDYRPSYDLKNFMSVSEPITDWTDANLYLQSYGGLLYLNKRIYPMSSQSVTDPVNTQDAGTALFKASRWVGYNYSGGDAIIFNEDNKTFLRYPGFGTTCLTLPTGSLFDFSTGMELLYSNYVPFNSGEVFAVLKNTATNKRYLARFTIAGKQNYFAEITGDDIIHAEQFAVSPDQGYLFYNVGGKVYEYDPALKSTFLMQDYGNRKVTVMKFQPFASTYPAALNAKTYTTLSKKLLICTYSPGNPDNSGAFDLYTVPDINAALQLFQSYKGMGKVSGIAYRER
ncbi:PKD-like family lipoprotein [Chitinophaga nivalis]|uniref:PKD-like family lipoprotein n=1 Tax=Chitinophaga nivalis TaxID=2991709 RepID=A0ABT3ITG6_9BACT|nr:PKD-like family lipoprotein [Chitinophaga nivalis]MCW3463028.1 PKD-like family lipoprotein [Chitinophaga nivalis]MCW3487282.1 PKD-like family lipoprotein [Chitinophaga nivalis]